MVGAGVPDETSLDIPGGSILASSDASSGVAVAPLASLFLSRTGAGGVGGSGLVAGSTNRGAAHPRSGVVKHPVGADESLFPGFLAEETVFDQEFDRLNNELVEELDSDLDGLILFITKKNGLVADAVLAEGGEPMAHASFGGKGAILEAEALGIVRVAGVTDVAQGLRSGPAVDAGISRASR